MAMSGEFHKPILKRLRARLIAQGSSISYHRCQNPFCRDGRIYKEPRSSQQRGSKIVINPVLNSEKQPVVRPRRGETKYKGRTRLFFVLRPPGLEETFPPRELPAANRPLGSKVAMIAGDIPDRFGCSRSLDSSTLLGPLGKEPILGAQKTT